MTYVREYEDESITREQLDESAGLRVIEFGANWCGYCIAAQPDIEAALAEHPELKHEKIADGPGRPLGRSFRVKLWPTLIAIRDGEEINRVVRPESADQVRQLFL
ncbi:MAG: thioredoxin [Alcanivorax borkumensis]|jgi:thioredoxin 1|uniref:Thioredoxin, putative n=1 Tax=Alcanivorax borkumensis (strain ATCC 700651 / DSM 11573 / NCIMB 13689 / SK2) TaxID=393595 RepID=Q0VRD4_ALCBS|nr:MULTISPECIES: thioredoxin family protein [Alcanivorax]OJH08501.1 MAG: thioredoxin [Alcanivorax borkumensis]EUC69731.1 thioredoxin [Alcanivorax sp. 97CO-5]PKG01569.1 thioredoxin [Alcanivorax sp. 97CO-6]CAL16264.1 thioredoxin, putative [Alcanivorax borkumensis SK2]BAP13716.1 thioredoxin [Alcanivorax sp. NBRC 101098]